jgi:hypothetical protein
LINFLNNNNKNKKLNHLNMVFVFHAPRTKMDKNLGIIFGVFFGVGS